MFHHKSYMIEDMLQKKNIWSFLDNAKKQVILFIRYFLAQKNTPDDQSRAMSLSPAP